MTSDSSYVHLPLVSIIISNYNYESYIKAAIDSCLLQSYPNIEIIVVDDVSSDSSVRIAKEALASCPRGRLIRRLTNGGQGPALLNGFRVSTGDFVVFLDADDVLFPSFVGTHVFAHLTLPWQVALTSSHLVHIGPTGRVMSGSSGAIRNTFRTRSDAVQLASLRIAPEIDRVLNQFASNIGRCVYLPANFPGYHWASCSGVFFKREAIEQIAFDEAIREIRTSADFYFTLAHYFNGSAVIDAKLGGYRIHGKNNFSGEVHLDHIDDCRHLSPNFFLKMLRSFVRCATNSRLEACYTKLGRNYPDFLASLQTYASYQNNDPEIDSRICAHAIVENYGPFTAVVGKERTLQILREKLNFAEEEVVQHCLTHDVHHDRLHL